MGRTLLLSLILPLAFSLLLSLGQPLPLFSQEAESSKSLESSESLEENLERGYQYYKESELENSKERELKYQGAAKIFAAEAQKRAEPLLFYNASVASYKGGDIFNALYYLRQAERLGGVHPEFSQNETILAEELGISGVKPWDQRLFLQIKRIPQTLFFPLFLSLFALFTLAHLLRFFQKKGARTLLILSLSLAIPLFLLWSFPIVYEKENLFGLVESETPLYSADNFGEALEGRMLQKGEEIRILREQKGWYLVHLSQGEKISGWLPQKRVQPYP